MRAHALRLLPIALGILSLPAARAYAQTVELRLLNDSGTTRISGAIVRLLGGGGAPVQGLTDELGRLVLRAPGPGTYRLKIDRIGWSGLVTATFQLGAGQRLQQEIRLESRRVSLPPLVVSGKTTCGLAPGGGELAATLWEEVRKALTANLLTEQARSVPIHVREFVREVDLRGHPLREWVVSSKLVRGGSFASLSVPDLVRNGFVQQAGDSLAFAAPDAVTLLADEFVASHCFRAVAGTGRLVGLAFAPARGRWVPDVSGTLWLERESSELRSLEYSYTGLEAPLADARLGGRLEFQRLAGGQWIVSYWHVRMPRMESRYGDLVGATKLRMELAGYYDRGGRAQVALDTLGRIDRAIVLGTVFDSTTGGGLAGAIIGIAGTADSIVVGADGRFELAASASGDQVVTARHPKLGLLGESTTRSVLLSLGDTISVEFAVPALERFVKALCSSWSDMAAVVGMVWNKRGERVNNREVRALRPSLHGASTIGKPVRTSSKGLYTLCSLPSRDTIQLVTADSGKALVEVRVSLEGQSRWIDLRDWGSADSSSVSLQLIAILPREPVLTGVVRTESGKPLAGVEVLVEGTESHATTDSSGRFTMGGLPPGDQVILFRVIGWKPVRQSVHLVEGDTARTEARLVTEGVALAPLTVTAMPKAPRGVGFEAFEERRRMGFGKFIDATELQRRENSHLEEVLRGIPGIRIMQPPDCRGSPRCDTVDPRMRVAASTRLQGAFRFPPPHCFMQVVLNGVIVGRGGDIDFGQAFDLNNLRIDELKAVEVYRSAAEIPAEFNDTRAACGVLVLWSKP